MSDSYNLLVIGAGTAAMVASMRVRAAGWRVAVVDSRPLGGTCALRGCDPKKMLIGGTSAVDQARRMGGKGRGRRRPCGLARAHGLQAILHRSGTGE